MNKWMDELENAADKLQNLGKRAIDEAAEQIEKIRPVIKDKLEDAKEASQKIAPAIEDGVEKAVDSLRAAYEKTLPAIEEGMDKAAQSAKDAYARATQILKDEALDAEFTPAEPVEEEEKPLTQEEQINQDVEAQMEQIRAARSAPNMISDFIAGKYGKKD